MTDVVPDTEETDSTEATRSTVAERVAALRDRFRRPPRDRSAPLPPLGPRAQLLRAVLIVVLVLGASLLLELLVVSGFEQRAAQQRLFDQFRGELALGTAPVGPTDFEGQVLAIGEPVAYLEIPTIGVRQVVVEGTSPGALFAGPGHRRDSPFPGQEGVAVVMGRRASFGGPFARIADLHAGDPIRVVTGLGTFEYEVMGVRGDGDPVPPLPEEGEGRLMLATADGAPFVPDGVIRVDAELTGEPAGGATVLLGPGSLPAREDYMGTDTGTLYALVLWLEVLIAVTAAAVWSWHRWSKVKTWVVFVPPLVLAGLFVSNEMARLLPNLL